MSVMAFLKGVARCCDLFGLLNDPIDLPRTDEEAFQRDAQALASDWEAIMRDAGYVFSQQEQNNE